MRLSLSAMASSMGSHFRVLGTATGKPVASSASTRACRCRSTATCSTYKPWQHAAALMIQHCAVCCVGAPAGNHPAAAS